MFLVMCTPGRGKWFDRLSTALDHAEKEALYGCAEVVTIRKFEWSDPLVTFNSERMRHAQKQQRQTRELQVSAGVHAGL
jgi:hypothetical protein